MLKFITLFLIFFVINIYSQADMEKEKEALMQVDTDFSKLSKEKGMIHAFLAYTADDGVLLRPNSYPIRGIDSLKIALGDDDSGFTLTWYPLFADISSSLDLGYTYGIYELAIKDKEGKDQLRKGTYLSVWKKQEDGKWKFVLDTGNAGLGEK